MQIMSPFENVLGPVLGTATKTRNIIYAGLGTIVAILALIISVRFSSNKSLHHFFGFLAIAGAITTVVFFFMFRGKVSPAKSLLSHHHLNLHKLHRH